LLERVVYKKPRPIASPLGGSFVRVLREGPLGGSEESIKQELTYLIYSIIVRFDWEDEETIRIISARKATRYEDQEYHKRIAD
jgi:hypothetical protein